MTTLSDKNILVTLGPKKQTGRLVLDILLVILLAATMLSLPGDGHAIHCVSGIFLLIGCGVHMTMHERWIKAVILERPKNITPTLSRQRRLFWSLLISGFLCGLSGLSGLVASPLTHGLFHVHILSGLVFFGLNIYHLRQHRNWFRKNLAIFSTASK